MPLWVETKIRAADPLPALSQLAKYHGLEKSSEGRLRARAWLPVFQQAGMDGEKLRAAALAILQIEE